MTYAIWTYVVYATAAVGLTAVLARTLHTNGAIFLADVFGDRPGMAQAVNNLLVIGFYMLNLGYAFLIFKNNNTTMDGLVAIEVLVTKLGTLLVSLGIIHFINMAFFWKLRTGQTKRDLPLPPPPAGSMYRAPAH